MRETQIMIDASMIPKCLTVGSNPAPGLYFLIDEYADKYIFLKSAPTQASF